MEQAVEMLSEMVNRPYLRTPQTKMGEVARNIDYLCEEYLQEMRAVAAVAAESIKATPNRPPPIPRPQEPEEQQQQMNDAPLLPGLEFNEDGELILTIGFVDDDGEMHLLRIGPGGPVNIT